MDHKCPWCAGDPAYSEDRARNGICTVYYGCHNTLCPVQPVVRLRVWSDPPTSPSARRLMLKHLWRNRSTENKAHDDEMVFVLLERDPSAPAAVDFWCQDRIRRGLNTMEDEKIKEAMEWANEVRERGYAGKAD